MNRFFTKNDLQRLKEKVHHPFHFSKKHNPVLNRVAPMDWIPKVYQDYFKDIDEKDISLFSRTRSLQ